jgi:peptidoglycan hydrolase CwlO-like protein
MCPLEQELSGDVCSLRDRKRQVDKERTDLEAARREVEEMRGSLETGHAKLAEGFNGLAQKRSEVLTDIEKENARLAKSWDQVGLACRMDQTEQASFI